MVIVKIRIGVSFGNWSSHGIKNAEAFIREPIASQYRSQSSNSPFSNELSRWRVEALERHLAATQDTRITMLRHPSQDLAEESAFSAGPLHANWNVWGQKMNPTIFNPRFAYLWRLLKDSGGRLESLKLLKLQLNVRTDKAAFCDSCNSGFSVHRRYNWAREKRNPVL